MIAAPIRTGRQWTRESVRCVSVVWPLALVAQVDPTGAGADGPQTARAMGFVLVAILLLVVFLLLGSLIFVRSARRYRAGVERRRRRRPKPTASADVWSMHKAPDDPESPSPSDTRSQEE